MIIVRRNVDRFRDQVFNVFRGLLFVGAAGLFYWIVKGMIR